MTPTPAPERPKPTISRSLELRARTVTPVWKPREAKAQSSWV